MIHAFGGLILRGVGIGVFHHFAQTLGIFQHGTGLEQILVERLVIVIGHEQGRLIGFQKGLFPDVGVGIVDEGAGLDVAVGVDVQVAATAGDAAVDGLAVVLEVDGENGYRFMGVFRISGIEEGVDGYDFVLTHELVSKHFEYLNGMHLSLNQIIGR